MSAVQGASKPPAKIFGISLGIDPKILVGGLVVLAAVMFWFNSRGEDSSSTTAAGSRVEVAPSPASVANARSRVSRRNRNVANDRGTLRIRAVDATRGDIDPTLRLELLSRLQSVNPAKPGRSLFEIGPEPAGVNAASSMPPIRGPMVPVVPQRPAQIDGLAQPGVAQVAIPLKFYGFVRPAGKGQSNQGLFLEGDNIMVASEGELIDHRYLVRELSAVDARLEDTQVKQGQTLHVVPEARPQ